MPSGSGRGLGPHGSGDAPPGPEPRFESDAPPVLCMAPKKEKGGTASNSSKIWEPSLVAAHFNQVSPGPRVRRAQARPGPASRPDPQPRRLPAATPPSAPRSQPRGPPPRVLRTVSLREKERGRPGFTAVTGVARGRRRLTTFFSEVVRGGPGSASVNCSLLPTPEGQTSYWVPCSLARSKVSINAAWTRGAPKGVAYCMPP